MKYTQLILHILQIASNLSSPDFTVLTAGASGLSESWQSHQHNSPISGTCCRRLSPHRPSILRLLYVLCEVSEPFWGNKTQRPHTHTAVGAHVPCETHKCQANC